MNEDRYRKYGEDSATRVRGFRGECGEMEMSGSEGIELLRRAGWKIEEPWRETVAQWNDSKIDRAIEVIRAEARKMLEAAGIHGVL